MTIREYRDARQGEILTFLGTHATWMKRYQNNEVRFRPSPCCGADNASNPSCQVEEVRGMWRCFSCGVKGNWFTLTKAFGHPLAEDDKWRDPLYQWDPNWVKGFKTAKRRPVTGGHYPELLDYCQGRGIGRDTLNKWLVSTKGSDNLRWPIFLYHGDEWQMVNARIRRCLNPNKSKANDWFDISGGPTDLLIGNHLIKARDGNRVIITEGQWDAMTCTELGMENVFSLPNGAGNIKAANFLRYIPEHWEIWLAMDQDESGDKAIEQFYHQLGPDRVKRLRTPVKDLNDWLQDCPDLTAKDVEQAVVGFVERTQVTGTSFMDFDMQAMPERESRLVIDTPFPELTGHLAGGFLAKQTTGILAPSGLGKTTLVNQLGIWATSHDVKVGLISLEGDRDALKGKLQDVIRGTCKQEQYGPAVANLIVSKLEGSEVTVPEVVGEMIRMAEFGARLMILDNLDFMTADDNSLKAKAYAGIVELSKNYNVHSIVVWQPNKVDRSQIVNSGNQKGYSRMLQDSDNYINLNRIRDFNRLQVEKCREEGVEGDGISWVLYSKEKRAFRPAAEAPDTNLGDDSKVIMFKPRVPG